MAISGWSLLEVTSTELSKPGNGDHRGLLEERKLVNTCPAHKILFLGMLIQSNLWFHTMSPRSPVRLSLLY